MTIHKAGIWALALGLLLIEAAYHLKWVGAEPDADQDLFKTLTVLGLMLGSGAGAWSLWRFSFANIGGYLFLVSGLVDLLDLMHVYVSAQYQELMYQGPYTRSGLVLAAMVAVAVARPHGPPAVPSPGRAPVPVQEGFFGVERAVLAKGKVGGPILMLVAVVWFVVGLGFDRIFFYPPVLFLFGLWGFFKAATGITSPEERIAAALAESQSSAVPATDEPRPPA
jgi:hypothetical protein